MSAPVDVLAVIDAELRTARGLASSDAYYAHSLPKLEAARDAVAELMAVVSDVYGDGHDGPPCDGPCPTCRLRAALARCQP